MPPLRIDREIRRQGERPLIEPFRAERFLAKRPIGGTTVINPGMEEQTNLLFQISASRQALKAMRMAQLWRSTFARWAVANTTSVQ
jgi:hypothetical protein